MTANETDPATGTRSTRPEAPAEAASDAPAGSPSQPRPTLPEGMGELDRRAIDIVRVLVTGMLFGAIPVVCDVPATVEAGQCRPVAPRPA